MSSSFLVDLRRIRLLTFLVLITIFGSAVGLPLAAQAPAANTAATKAYEAGLSAVRAGDLAKAQAELEKAVKLSPSNAGMQLALGQVLLHRGELDGAVAALQTVVRLNPAIPAAHLFLGQALSAKGLQDEAIAQFREAIKLAPKDANAHRALAHSLSAQQKTARSHRRNEVRRCSGSAKAQKCTTSWAHSWRKADRLRRRSNSFNPRSKSIRNTNLRFPFRRGPAERGRRCRRPEGIY